MKRLTSVRSLFHLAVGIALTASFSACEFSCGAGGIDTAKAEKLIADNLEKQNGIKPKSVECPDKVEEKKGESFTCKVTLDDGATFDATVEMKGDGNVSAKWDLGGGAAPEEGGGEPMPEEEGGEPMPEEGGEPMPEEGGGEEGGTTE